VCVNFIKPITSIETDLAIDEKFIPLALLKAGQATRCS